MYIKYISGNVPFPSNGTLCMKKLFCTLQFEDLNFIVVSSYLSTYGTTSAKTEDSISSGLFCWQPNGVMSCRCYTFVFLALTSSTAYTGKVVKGKKDAPLKNLRKVVKFRKHE